MTGARGRILESIRSGLVRAALPPAEHAGVPDAKAGGGGSIEAMVERFGAVLTALSGRMHRASSPEVPALVADIAAAHGARSFLAWDETELGCPGLLEGLAARGLARVDYRMPTDPDARFRLAQALEPIGLGVTGGHAAIAENGAVVLVSGPGRGRLVSLLPAVHVAIVSERRLRPTLADLVREEPRLLDAGSNVVLVAGPSRTADIEMALSHGVHGPKHVHVILTA
ncbi:MAG TPA: lactate utilization protein [Vicinamibacterales bacterium]|nr:lactate utilization protein [Vicinamibacterales bacterium]HOQ61396.1 lactate utilization protein [Vicinamibacterales bacterium]HPK72682.1 lactate utilization protein [Vicinamibacterales bacterium]